MWVRRGVGEEEGVWVRRRGVGEEGVCMRRGCG